jgi:hypothetical protein
MCYGNKTLLYFIIVYYEKDSRERQVFRYHGKKNTYPSDLPHSFCWLSKQRIPM